MKPEQGVLVEDPWLPLYAQGLGDSAVGVRVFASEGLAFRI